MGQKVYIYTAIFGAYDNLKEQPPQNLDCEFLCFTDNPELRSKTWRIIQHEDERTAGMPTRMRARRLKIMNHELFSPPARKWWPFPKADGETLRCDYSIWIDGSVRIKQETFAEEMIGYLGRYGMAMFIHPDRDCIYDEAEVCAQPEFIKNRGLPLREQVEHYRSEGYPERNGLIATTVLARDMRRKELSKINRDWWQELLKWTNRDQLSLPYVLWKNHYGYDPINLNHWDNHLFGQEWHNSQL